jgi:hypothetical protein
MEEAKIGKGMFSHALIPLSAGQPVFNSIKRMPQHTENGERIR